MISKPPQPRLIGLLSLALALVFSFGSLFLLPSILSAQTTPAINQTNQPITPIKLNLAPSTAYIKVRSGQKAVHTIALENQGSQPLLVKPKLVDFHPNGKNGLPVLGKTLTFPYFKLPKTGLPTIKLQPKGKAKIDLVINPGSDAPTQEYPVAVMFQAAPVNQNASATQLSATVVSNLVILVVNQERDLGGTMTIEIDDLPTLVDSFRPLSFKLLAKNPTKTAKVATGSAVIKNLITQKQVIALPVMPTTILAHSTRYLLTTNTGNANLDQTNETERNQTLTDTFLTPKQFWLGIYLVTTTINQSQTATKYIVALPISLLILTIIGVIILISVYFINHYWTNLKPTR